MSIQESITKAAVEGASEAILKFADSQITYYRDECKRLQQELNSSNTVGRQLQSALNDVGNLVGIQQGQSLLTEVQHLVSEALRELQMYRTQAGIVKESVQPPPPEPDEPIVTPEPGPEPVV